MLKNYLTTALRNFWRNKTFSFINIIGLSIGISASLIIFLLVQYDLSFDKFEKDSTLIYRAVGNGSNQNGTWYNNCLAEPLADAAKKQVSGLDLVVPFRTLYDTRVSLSNNKLILRKQKDLVAVDPGYFKLINYTWLAGTPETSISQPYQAVLTEKNAKLYFANTNYSDIIGKPIILDDTVQCTVTGIVKDLPGNSDFYFGTMISRATYLTTRMKPDGFGNWNWTENADQLFVKLLPGSNPAAVGKQMTQILAAHDKPDPNDPASKTAVSNAALQPLADIHFNLDYGVFDNGRQAHKPTLYYLLAVAAFLLLLACINFINLTTAQASQRAKEIGIRKTMGSHRRQLTIQFLTETFVLTSLATILSIILTPFLLNVFADFIPAGFHFNLFKQPQVIAFLLILTGIVSFLSGIYPALILSGFKPVSVLKNQTVNSSQTRSAWLRKSLTVFQFVIAQVFIIGTLLVSKQIGYALNRDLGFKKDAIVHFQLNYAKDLKKKIVFINQLKTIPGISQVSLANNPPSTNNTWTVGFVFNDGKKEIRDIVQVKLADTNYMRMYGLRLLAGTIPPQSDTSNAAVINETYLHKLGYQDPNKVIGMQLKGWGGDPRIVGVAADFFTHSLRENIKPLAILNGVRDANVVNIALQPRAADGSNNWPTTLAAVERTIHSFYPQEEFDYQFVDETLAKFYTAEKNVSRLLIWATGLTIFISCLGLLGLVIYITNQRTKEIGIRKVIGASVTQLIALLSRDFLKLIGLAILIALPIAWWGSIKWLDNFAYKTELNWWIFAAGGGILLLVALLILCIRTLRAALANPVNALRSE